MKWVSRIKQLYWLGLIGIVGMIFNIQILTYLMLFFPLGLLGFVEALSNKSERKIIGQSFAQIWGMIYTPISYKFNLPSKENYTLKNKYILPVAGKWTVVNGGFDKKLSHSWHIYPQRYAYDFIRVDDEGACFTGDKTDLNSYHCYGKEIVAPADGVVILAKNEYADSKVDGEKVYCDAPDINGNHIMIEHNDSEYSLLVHLMPNSLTVNTGDLVKQGQIIAKCGNSGNTSMPHLHYQLQSSKNMFLSSGLPIAFTDIQVEAKQNYNKLDPRLCENNYLLENNLHYIARGLEVENKH